jgi:DNA sulfur modification protein DndE
LTPPRVRLSVDATNRLKSLKGRTGMDHNVYCRIGLCHSLADPRHANPDEFDEKGQEIAQNTLLGEWEIAYLALLRERCIIDGLDPSSDLSSQLRAHVNRGVMALSGRLKDLGDLVTLLPSKVTK